MIDHYGLLVLITAGAAFTQGFSGFGYGILVMASMTMLNTDFERVSVFVTLTNLALVALLLIRSRKTMQVDWKQAGWLSLGLLITVPIGYRFVLRFGDMPICRLIFGVFLVLFALSRLFRPHLKRHISLWFAPLFGMFSGLLSGAFASGGPPVVIYLYSQEDDPRLAVGTTQAVFFGGSLYRLGTILFGERGVSPDVLSLSLWMTPVVVVAAAIGFRTAHCVTGRTFLLSVYGLIILAGVMNIVKGLAG